MDRHYFRYRGAYVFSPSLKPHKDKAIKKGQDFILALCFGGGENRTL